MEVKNNVPVPSATRGGQKRKYPFNDMEPNDCLTIDDDDTFSRARRAASAHAKKHGGKFISRKGFSGEEFVGNGGSIWRVE